MSTWAEMLKELYLLTALPGKYPNDQRQNEHTKLCNGIHLSNKKGQSWMYTNYG